MVNPRSGSTNSKEKDNRLHSKDKDFDDVTEEDIDELVDESDAEEDNEYEVEKVVGHRRDRGVLSYFIKWKGYGVQDNTWEKEDQVFCEDLVEAYWDRYTQAGGKKTDLKGMDPKPQGVKRKAAGGRGGVASKESHEPLLPEVPPIEHRDDDTEKSPSVTSPSKKARDGANELPDEQGQAKKHKPEAHTSLEQADESQNEVQDEQDEEPRKAGKVSKDVKAKASKEGKAGKAGKASQEEWPPASWTSWEDEVDFVQTVERNKKKMRVYLVWNNGKQTDHPIEDAHNKCPLKLIRFYEEHLKFTQS
ncbi:hypothetical protein BGZ68_003290 [Mortierella alpina]|nr:hypothetical protein BGZ68_003290 [Mortierella alpina]